jgi:hypothetical protein
VDADLATLGVEVGTEVHRDRLGFDRRPFRGARILGATVGDRVAAAA